MPIDPNATAKDYTTILYNKTEVDAQNDAETIRVDNLISLKSDKIDEGSPSGIATLGSTGKHIPTQIPFSTASESGDDTNNYTVMTPQRTLTQIANNTLDPDLVGVASGLCPLDVNAIVDPSFLPPSQNVQTFVVSLLNDMYNLSGVLAGDRCVVTNETDTALNGEYVALVDIVVPPSDSSSWDLLPNLSAVQSVNNETGNVFVDASNTPDIATNQADIITNGVAIVANSDRMTAERTFRDKTGIDVDTLIDLGENAVTDNLPNNADGVPYIEGIITVYGDERSVVTGNGLVQLFWNGATVANGDLDGAYIARGTDDKTADPIVWTVWEVEPVYTDADYFDFTPQTPPLSHKEGRFFYDETSKTHVGYTDIVGVSRNYGEQFDIRCHNATGTSLPNGVAVRGINSATGGYPDFVRSNTTTYIDARVAGVLTNIISNGNDGYATVVGSVGVDTTDATLFDWTPAEGDAVYLNDAGGYSNTRGAIFSYIGQITVIGIDGKMFVKPTTVVDDPEVGAYMNVTATKALTISTTPIAIQGYDNSNNEGMVIDQTTGIIQAPFDGTYTFSGSLFGTADSNNKMMFVEIWDLTNTLTVARQALSTNLGATDAGATSFSFDSLVLTGNQYIIRLYTSDGPYNFNVEELQFAIKSQKLNTGF